ncbi:MAG: 5'-3' exonuclease H3TH domain-containing protein [Acidobacteriota bacterium]
MPTGFKPLAMARIYLIDGTYELFRAHYGAPRKQNKRGREVGASIGFIKSMLALIRDEEVTHLACAFDHVVESFRNELFEGYKSGADVEPELLDQFELVELAASALGVVVWPMIRYEADDALATAAARWAQDEEVEQIVICSPDKDLAQCVSGSKVVCLDRRKRKVLDEEGVVARFGITPQSIPDWLALVGDAADGFPGIPGWGPKSSSTVLGRYRHLEDIPPQPSAWKITVRGAARLARKLQENLGRALLFRDLATLRAGVELVEDLDQLRWRGARRGALKALSAELGEPALLERVTLWRAET